MILQYVKHHSLSVLILEFLNTFSIFCSPCKCWHRQKNYFPISLLNRIWLKKQELWKQLPKLVCVILKTTKLYDADNILDALVITVPRVFSYKKQACWTCKLAIHKVQAKAYNFVYLLKKHIIINNGWILSIKVQYFLSSQRLNSIWLFCLFILSGKCRSQNEKESQMNMLND